MYSFLVLIIYRTSCRIYWLNNLIMFSFIVIPFFLLIFFFFLIYKFSNEIKTNE